jgi:CheY-like chemotaxis protein
MAALSGLRVLVLEDDYFTASDLSEALRAAGAEVVGPARNTAEAGRLLDARQRLDAATLDINVDGAPDFQIAERLKQAGVPFVFTTGYDRGVIPEGFSECARVEKPYSTLEVVAALTHLSHRAA